MKFNIIAIDAPWSFKTYSDKGKGRSSERHYKTMSFEDICNIPVWKLTDDNCALFCWATSPMLILALDAIRSWDFTFKGVCFVWVKTTKDGTKPNTGLGYWSRTSSEFCLLATKGHPKRVSASVNQTVLSPRMAHSEKPPEVKKRIVQLMGDLPRIELFARVDTEKVDGWRCIGDSLSGRDICQDIDIVSQL